MSAADLRELADRDVALIYEALRFFVWSAGQGICPVAGEPASEPEEVLFQYAIDTGDEDYDGLPDRIAAAIRARAQENEHG